MKLQKARNGWMDGFSLVEAVLGLVLIVVALQTAIPLAMSSSQVSSLVLENHMARIEARRKIDEIRDADFASIQGTYDGQGFDVDVDQDGTRDLTPVRGASQVGTVTVGEVPGGYLLGEALQVTVTLRWQSTKGDHTFRLTTTIAKD